MTALLEVKALRVAYGGINAVKGIDLAVDEGEMVALIGANGAGKTTTLKAICGLLHHAGTVQLRGEDVSNLSAYQLVERGLARLEWMVVRDFAMTETANFWQKGRLVQRGELTPDQIDTEVFFLPAALVAEKEGSVTNTSRLVQWHDQVCEPPGDSRSDLWFLYHLGIRLKALYADSPLERDRPIRRSPGNTRCKATRQNPTPKPF